MFCSNMFLEGKKSMSVFSKLETEVFIFMYSQKFVQVQLKRAYKNADKKSIKNWILCY